MASTRQTRNCSADPARRPEGPTRPPALLPRGLLADSPRLWQRATALRAASHPPQLLLSITSAISPFTQSAICNAFLPSWGGAFPGPASLPSPPLPMPSSSASARTPTRAKSRSFRSPRLPRRAAPLDSSHDRADRSLRRPARRRPRARLAPRPSPRPPPRPRIPLGNRRHQPMRPR